MVFRNTGIYSILRGLFILIPDPRLISLHGNSSQQILKICAEQILEAHFQGECFSAAWNMKPIERLLRQQRKDVSETRPLILFHFWAQPIYYLGTATMLTKLLRCIFSQFCAGKALLSLGYPLNSSHFEVCTVRVWGRGRWMSESGREKLRKVETGGEVAPQGAAVWVSVNMCVCVCVSPSAAVL